MLGLPEDCRDLETIKDAYKRKAKLFHPDSSSHLADKEKFTQLAEAYSHLQKSLANGAEAEKDEDKDKEESNLEFDIRHTVPQHRQYLEFGGKGYGTPSARQEQFDQIRREEAAERVLEYRQKKFDDSDETALLVADKKKAKDVKVSNAIERLVEDLILDSMRKGEFFNLKGHGKPLNLHDYNHFIDTTTMKINQIIIQDGFKPEWIELEKEIRQQITNARQQLSSLRDEITRTTTMTTVPPPLPPPSMTTKHDLTIRMHRRECHLAP